MPNAFHGEPVSFGSRRAPLGVAVIQAFFVGDMLCQHFVY
jgi:hypothetical protein